MLVLSRRVGERVFVGEAQDGGTFVVEASGPIIISVVGIGRGKVKLGFEAPRGLPVVREELLESELPTAALASPAA